MRVTFTKLAGRRYLVAIDREHGPPLQPRHGPGYDEQLPHDIAALRGRGAAGHPARGVRAARRRRCRAVRSRLRRTGGAATGGRPSASPPPAGTTCAAPRRRSGGVSPSGSAGPGPPPGRSPTSTSSWPSPMWSGVVRRLDEVSQAWSDARARALADLRLAARGHRRPGRLAPGPPHQNTPRNSHPPLRSALRLSARTSSPRCERHWWRRSADRVPAPRRRRAPR